MPLDDILCCFYVWSFLFKKKGNKNMKLKKKSITAVLTLSMSMSSVLSMVPVYAEVAQQNFSVKQNSLCFK